MAFAAEKPSSGHFLGFTEKRNPLNSGSAIQAGRTDNSRNPNAIQNGKAIQARLAVIPRLMICAAIGAEIMDGFGPTT